MIRPRAGDFVYSSAEFAQMKKSIKENRRQAPADWSSVFLKPRSHRRYRSHRELLELAQPLPVTFHRAFDACADLTQALEDVVRSGAARILTSGGAATLTKAPTI